MSSAACQCRNLFSELLLQPPQPLLAHLDESREYLQHCLQQLSQLLLDLLVLHGGVDIILHPGIGISMTSFTRLVYQYDQLLASLTGSVQSLDFPLHCLWMLRSRISFRNLFSELLLQPPQPLLAHLDDSREYLQHCLQQLSQLLLDLLVLHGGVDIILHPGIGISMTSFTRLVYQYDQLLASLTGSVQSLDFPLHCLWMLRSRISFRNLFSELLLQPPQPLLAHLDDSREYLQHCLQQLSQLLLDLLVLHGGVDIILHPGIGISMTSFTRLVYQYDQLLASLTGSVQSLDFPLHCLWMLRSRISFR
ncbi:uncharacterized protein [Salminus brasiliensis]|uniref:uncharacterized protein n=1 Tax=Salminus brasiliensis TaxID=930266 RepID=UPI003B82F533